MGLRFRKSLRIMPGVRVNLSGSGVSTSLGRRGAVVNIGKQGTRLTIGLPGTGLSHSQWLSQAKAPAPALAVPAAGMPAPARRKREVWRMLAMLAVVLGLLWLAGLLLPA